MGYGFALALVYLVGWVALTIVLVVLAAIFRRKTKVFTFALVVSLVSLPLYVAVELVGERFRVSSNESRQAAEAKTAQDLCAEVENMPVDIVSSHGVDGARVVISVSPGQMEDVLPVSAGPIARRFRDNPRLCEKSRLLSIQDQPPPGGMIARADAAPVPIRAQTFEVCSTGSSVAPDRLPVTYALEFTLDRTLPLAGPSAGMALRKFGMRLVDQTDMHVVKRSGFVTGPNFVHLPRACLDTAGQVSEFLRDALPR